MKHIPFVFRNLFSENLGLSRPHVPLCTLRALAPYFRIHISKSIGYKIHWVCLLIMLAFCSPTMAEPTALPLPRYVSLRSNAVNLHVGPGKNYPIDWCYVRQNLPVEIIAEFDTWRQIRDWQGAEGWVHKSLLSGKRTVWVLHKVRPLRKGPDEKAKVIAQLQPGVVAKAVECQGNWCKIEVKYKNSVYKGWIKRRCLWGIYPNEMKFD